MDCISRNLPSYKRNRLILDVLFRSKDVEKSGTGFQRVNDVCCRQHVAWSFRKEAYGFFFEFSRNSAQLRSDLSEPELVIFNLLKNNERITKSELAVRIGRSERTVQRIITALMSKQLVVREGSNKSGYWRVKMAASWDRMQ